MSLATVFVLVFFILTSVFMFYYLKQTRTVMPVINEVKANLTLTTTTTRLPREYSSNPLLFPRIRWASFPLTIHTIPDNCTGLELQEVVLAMNIWKEKTNGLVYFIDSNSNDADVIIDCLSNSSSIREGGRIIRKVAEGGPTFVYDTGLFNLTTKGKIHLYTSTVGCDRPIIPLHEIGHVLGLDHSDNPDSVMYEYEECNQDITPEIVSTLRSLYSLPAKPDLYFSDANAYQQNFYLFINLTIKNQGLTASDPTSVSILVNGKEVKFLSLNSIKPGQGYVFTLTNLFVSSEVSDLKLSIDPKNNVDELYKSNNIISLSP
jgi:hypothetical protein